jgi:ribonuclease Z
VKRVVVALVVVAALVVAAGAALVRLSPAVQDVVVRRTIAARARPAHTELLGRDALRVVFCGTGSPLPDRDRGQACAAVLAGGHLFLVDAGTGAAERLQRFRLPGEALEGVLLTHFHSDHVTGIPEIVLNTWVAGRTQPLTLWGGPGVEAVAQGFQTALGPDSRYRRAHHGPAVLPERGAVLEPVLVQPPASGERVPVLERDGVTITAFRVEHPPIDPAYGYRLDFGGRSVVFSGDTVPSASVVAAARGADVLVHEALSAQLVTAIADALEAAGDAQRARILRDVPSYHTTPVDAARVANDAGVALLALTHLVPPVAPGLPQRVFLRGVAEVRPEGTIVADDGLLLELPVGSKEIRTRMLD